MSRRTSAAKPWSSTGMPLVRSLMISVAVAIAAAAVLSPPPAAAAQELKTPGGKAKTALAPPAPARDPEAPPEGKGAGGLDFGPWRSRAPQITAGAFTAEVGRLAAAGDLRGALGANGFSCFDPARPGIAVVCVRSALEGACGYDWTVEIPVGAATPRARYEAHCLQPRGRTP
ncbi:MAG: hypothetical protein KJS97_06435 [Alphaproteobacteria bacterium]|nr:hypothetical protein [Alphaproteobacteria bacterium]